jgi:hypothetical protein
LREIKGHSSIFPLNSWLEKILYFRN